jgi:hypothetical protein
MPSAADREPGWELGVTEDPKIFVEITVLRAEQNWTELNRAKVDFYTNRPDRPGGSALVRTVR